MEKGPSRMNMEELGWNVLEDGGSGRWIYSKQVEALVWLFLRMDDMVDSCGGDATYYFHCDVGVVDMQQATECGTLAEALKSCDADSWMHDLPEESRPLAMAQCLFDHGAWSPLWQEGSPEIDKEADEDWKFNIPDESDPDFLDLLEAGRKWAEENALDYGSRTHLLDTKIVNGIGQTAREFAGGTGSLWNTLRRIKSDPNATDEQKLVLKMYRNVGNTLGAGPVPQDIIEEER